VTRYCSQRGAGVKRKMRVGAVGGKVRNEQQNDANKTSIFFQILDTTSRLRHQQHIGYSAGQIIEFNSEFTPEYHFSNLRILY
jgi:hypothetical protein